MDPVVAAVITIIGKYAIDKGVELTKEAGPKAVEIAEKIFKKVAERFGKNPADTQNLEKFEQKPDTYQAPIADALEEQMKDAVFASEIKQLLAQYKAAAPKGAPGTTTITQIAGDNAIQIGQASGSTISLSQKEDDKRT